MAHLFRVLVPVKDIEAAERFYARVLGSSGTRVSPGRHYFDGGVILACYDPSADGDGYEATPNPEAQYLGVPAPKRHFEHVAKLEPISMKVIRPGSAHWAKSPSALGVKSPSI